MDNILKNMNCFVDGLGFAGKAKVLGPPNLSIPGEDFRAAGMDAPVSIDMGMDPLEASATFGSYERAIFQAWGKVAPTTQVQFRGALAGLNGDVTPIILTMTGRISGLEMPEWTAGQMSEPKITIKPVYYRCEHGGIVVHEIDVLNNVRIINGVDQLAAIRAAIGQ
jgi:P2 family phage contractile tail tube protein